MNYDAVLEGGGAKLFGLIGALSCLEARGFTVARSSGVSAGAIVAAVQTAGYSAAEMKEILFGLDLEDLLDGGTWGTKTYNILVNKGIYKGEVIESLIKDLLERKGIKTFGDITFEGKSKLKVLVSDITNQRLTVFPDDAHLYGLDPNEVEIAWAVRASIAIPGFFRPVIYNDNYFVDGGLLSNFPIWIFDAQVPRWPTFGMLLRENSMGKKNHINRWPHSFISAIFQTALSAHDKMFVKPEEYLYRTIQVPVGDTSTTDFGMDQDTKQWLYTNGYVAATRFLDAWSWNKYYTWATTMRNKGGENG